MSAEHRVRRVSLLGSAVLAATVLTVPVFSATPAYAGCPALHQGMRGSCVLTLQKRLAGLHYDISRPDGVFGAETYHAVMAFKKVNGLPRNGTVGSRMWWRLYHRTVIARARYARSGSALEVNVTRQVLLRIARGAVVRIYDVSTGRPSFPTPLRYGTPLRIWKKVLWGTTGLHDTEHYVQYFYRGTLLALHAYGYVPPWPSSHGCIRLWPPSGARLYAATFVGERLFTYA